MTHWQDIVNAGFEGSAIIWVGLNCRDIWRKRIVAGQTLIANLSFSAWGIWNLYFYSGLNQWFSAIAGIGVCVMNFTLLSLVIKFREKP